jgi:hypothetical protein
MICIAGLYPKSHAGNATLTACDLSERGGMFTINRLISPRRQASNFEAITSMWGLSKNLACGFSSQNDRSTKAIRSQRINAARSPGKISVI